MGPKAKYVYTDDQGVPILITRDETLGDLPNTGLVAFDPANPPAGIQPAPKRFDFRGVYWQGTDVGFEDARKFIICGTNAATLYASNSAQALTIDGVAGLTTGRKGEQLSF